MRGVAGLVLADLPVDLVVVLEQQERAGHAYSTERALRKLVSWRGGEHVFVSYEAVRTDPLRTCVRIARVAGKWLCRADLGLRILQRELQQTRISRPVRAPAEPPSRGRVRRLELDCRDGCYACQAFDRRVLSGPRAAS
jgi:hypothetical protein